MNNMLAEFASIQVEAIDGVLEMVARDRQRVEALLAEVESPSLRTYLQQWLESTPEPALPVIGVAPEDDFKSICLSEEEEEVCCPLGCWKDPENSFWDIFLRRPKCARGIFCRAIQNHHALRSRLAFGVSYEWVTETTNIGEGYPEGFSNGKWDWEDEDHYFLGRTVCQEDHNPALEDAIDTQYQLRDMMPPGEFHRSALIRENEEGLLHSIFEDQPGCLPTVDQVMKAGGSIYYDIVFIAAELSDILDRELVTILRHHRTAKGALKLTSNKGVLAGTIQLDPSMQRLDAIPFGDGSFTWTETSRLERIASARSHSSSDWTHMSTNVLFVTGKVSSVQAKGEVRVIRRRTASFQEDEPLVDHCSPTTLDVAAHMMQKYKQKQCLWMHRHTRLPVEVIERIAVFVSPPPVFYLEPGDLVLDMDWGAAILNCLRRNNDSNEIPPMDLMSLATIVARPRR